ncbi:MAG: adenylyl-sulfate kinase [Rhodospirillaceae bacterium]|nr:adenylyl-sulfate kinase [Rhodospirillaceae bacterium]
MAIKSKNITKVEHRIKRDDRWAKNGHRGAVVWFTGLSASGKSTLATMLEKRLFELGRNVFVLDGDNVRHGLCSDLGFSAKDREENIRRIGELAALFAQSGLIVITAFISPYQRDRRQARIAVGENFHEIYLDASIDVCEGRDPKGLYAKARSGEIADFTGISAPYETPENPELIIDTGAMTVDEGLDAIIEYVEKNTAL